MHRAVLALLLSLLTAWAASAERFDLVLKGGRVVDPETGLDAVRDVGLRGDRVARISTEPLDGSPCPGCSGPGGRPRLHRSPPASAGRRVLSAQGTRRRHDGTRAGERCARRRAIPGGAAREDLDPLRNDGKPGGRSGGGLGRGVGAADLRTGRRYRRSASRPGNQRTRVARPPRAHPCTAAYGDRRRRPGHRDGARVHARRHPPRGDRDLPARRGLRLARLRSLAQCGPDRAGLEHRVRRRDDRGKRRHRCRRPHRAPQQQLPGGCAGMPEDDRGRPRAWSRRHDRGLSVRGRHDDDRLGDVQPRLAGEARDRLRRRRAARVGRALDPRALRGTARFARAAQRPDSHEPGPSRGRGDPTPAGDDRERRHQAASAQRRDLRPRARALFPDSGQPHVDGRGAQDVADAGPAPRSRHRGGTPQGAAATRRRRGHRRLRPADASRTRPRIARPARPASASVTCWSLERWSWPRAASSKAWRLAGRSAPTQLGR